MKLKKAILSIGWSVLGLSCVVLLAAAMKARNNKACSKVVVEIENAGEPYFINKTEVEDVLKKNNIRAGETLQEINLKNAESQLEKNAWVKDAELFFDNQQVLHADIKERAPLARVFTLSGNSFYIDSSGLRLPVSETATARVIVFTSFPSDNNILSKPDSLVLDDVKTLAAYISADSFLNAQATQVNITGNRTYEIVPVIGDQLIRIGNTENLKEKFNRLLAFYKQVWSKVGIDKYSVIDIQYHDQVVAVRKGEGPVYSDTSRAMRQLKQADAKLNMVLNDTTYAAPLSKAGKDVGKNVSNMTDKSKVPFSEKGNTKKPKAVMKKSE